MDGGRVQQSEFSQRTWVNGGGGGGKQNKLGALLGFWRNLCVNKLEDEKWEATKGNYVARLLQDGL